MLKALSALALAHLAQKAGIPEGMFNVTPTSRPHLVGEILTQHPKVRKLSFTGSTEVGKLLMRQCASTVKRVSLELGGNAPFLIFDDADIQKAVAGLIQSKFRNAGQTCICPNRVLVQDRIFGRFIDELVRQVRTLTMGPGWQEGVQIGPLIDEMAVEKITNLVDDGLQKGARCLIGGKRVAKETLFFESTVVVGIQPHMHMVQEEIFGPIVAILRFSMEQEALQLANDTPDGLASYVYTQDLNRALRVSERLDFGIVGVNEALASTEIAPFGGIKESGLGREGSKYGIE